MTENIDYVKRAFDFLTEQYPAKSSFSKQEFEDKVEDPNIDTYWSKKFRHLLEEDPNNDGKYFVSPVFRRYNTLSRFKRYFSQSTKIKGEYFEEIYDAIIFFEFFMPLNNETALRSALDELFYKDVVKRKLKRIRLNDLFEAFSKENGETEARYEERICKWISRRFEGYSIESVKGRYRVEDLKRYDEVSKLLSSGRRYLIDESTAIVRFIFHIGEPLTKQSVDYGFDQYKNPQRQIIDKPEIEKEIKQIRFIFKNLFVKTILNLVEGEDEIWMLERGLNNERRLFIWKNKT